MLSAAVVIDALRVKLIGPTQNQIYATCSSTSFQSGLVGKRDNNLGLKINML